MENLFEHDDVFRGYGVEVSLTSPNAFNIIREVLTRVGMVSDNTHTIYQSAHIFHKRGRYRILHFKEMLAFDGKSTDIDADDLLRRDGIVGFLVERGLIADVPSITSQDVDRLSDLGVEIFSHEQAKSWNRIQKYTFLKRPV